MPATASKFKLKPLADKVVIEIESDNEQSSGGIYIPETAREKPQKGVVVAVGPGSLLESGQRSEMSVKPGDRVMFQKYGGTDVRVDDTDYKILSERDLLGVLEA